MTPEQLKNELGGLIWKTATNLVHGGKNKRTLNEPVTNCDQLHSHNDL